MRGKGCAIYVLNFSPHATIKIPTAIKAREGGGMILSTTIKKMTASLTQRENINAVGLRIYKGDHKIIYHFQHYHSMETFAHFEIFDMTGKRAAEGHKVKLKTLDKFFSLQNSEFPVLNESAKIIMIYHVKNLEFQ